MAELTEKAPPVQEINFDFKNNMTYNPRCLCDNSGCPRHGNCRLCAEFHRINPHPATCKYDWKWKPGAVPEKTVKRFSEQTK